MLLESPTLKTSAGMERDDSAAVQREDNDLTAAKHCQPISQSKPARSGEHRIGEKISEDILSKRHPFRRVVVSLSVALSP